MPNPNLPNEPIDNATQQRLRTDEAYDQEQSSKDFQYGGGGSFNEFNYESPGTFGQTYSPQPVNTSIAYSGSDCKAFIVTYGQIAKDSFIPLKNLGAISYSIHRDKAPVRGLGSFEAKAYTKGTRTIAGSIVIINFDRAAFFELVAGTNIYGENGSEIELSDNIPAFDILLVFSEENKGRLGAKWTNGMIGPPKPDDAADFSYMWIRDVHFVDEGSVTGTDEAYLETTFQYVAKDLEYLKPNNIMTNPQDVNTVAANISGTPATTQYQRCVPHRMFLKQTDELATYEDRTEDFNLTLDRTESRTFNDEFEWLVSDEADADATRSAGTSGMDSVWQRPNTIIKMDPSQVNIHAQGNLTLISELSTVAKPEGTGFEMVPLKRGAYQYDTATVNNTGEITLHDSYIFEHPRTQWQEFFQTNFPPKFGNKYQFDLHNVAKPRVEEAELQVVYNGTNPDHTPGAVNFPIPNADVQIDPHAGFANDNDPMLTAFSPIRQHDITIVDAGNVTVDIQETDVQQTLTETFEVVLTSEEGSISHTYTNDSDDRATVYIGVTGYCTDSGGNPVSIPDASEANGPQNCNAATGNAGTWIARSSSFFPYLKDPSMQPLQISITDPTGTITEGPNADQFEFVAYNATNETFEIKAPPNKLIDKSVESTRPGPAIQSFTVQTTDTTEAPWDPFSHMIPTDNAGPGNTKVLALSEDHIVIEATGQVSGIKWYSGGDLEITSLETILDNNTNLPSHSEITYTGLNQIKPTVIGQSQYVSPTSNTTQYNQAIGKYEWTASNNIEQFEFVEEALGHSIQSVNQINVDYSDLAFHPLLEPGVVMFHHFTPDTDNFTVTGGRDWKYYQNNKNTTMVPTNGEVVFMDDVPDGYSFKGPDGNLDYAFLEFKNYEGFPVFEWHGPLYRYADGRLIVDISQWCDPVTLSQGWCLIDHQNSNTNQPENVNSIEINFEYMYTDPIPFGIDYTAVDPTPLSTTFVISDVTGKAYIPDFAGIDENSLDVTVRKVGGGENPDATFTFDANTNSLTVDGLKSSDTSAIDYTFQYQHQEVFDTVIQFQGILMEGNNSAATELILNLGQEPPINFNKETDVTITCANSSATVIPSEFGIVVGDLVQNADTGNHEVAISGIPPMVIMEANRPGWLGCLWDLIFGSPTMPVGNLIFNAVYKVYDPNQVNLRAELTYTTIRKPNGQLINSPDHRGETTADGYIVGKQYDDGNEGGLFSDPSDPLSIQIINPQQDTSQGICDCTLSGGNPGCSITIADKNSCEAVGGTWTGGPIPHTPVTISHPRLSYSHIYEITDYNNQSSPPELMFQVDGVHLLAKDTEETVEDYTFDLTYDVQRGALPITINYVRATGQTYPNIETKTTYTFDADIPLFKVDLGTAYGSYYCSDGQNTLPITDQNECMCGAGNTWDGSSCSGGTCSDGTSSSENICLCGAGGVWNGVDCTTGTETTNTWTATASTGNIWAQDSGNAQGPVDLVTEVKWKDVGGYLNDSGPVLKNIEPVLDDDGNIIGPDTLSLTDPLESYMFGKDPNTSSGSPLSVFFPTGINPHDSTALTDGTQPSSQHDPYQVQVSYRSLTSYIPAAKYTQPGYFMTGLLNVTGYEAIELVLDVERNSVNYYRGLGACADSSFLTAEGCAEAGHLWVEDGEQDRVLCEEALSGTWLMEQDSLFPGIMKAVGVCELGAQSINTLINDQIIIQFGFWLVGPSTDANGHLALTQPVKERFLTLEEAVSSMQEAYKETFGV